MKHIPIKRYYVFSTDIPVKLTSFCEMSGESNDVSSGWIETSSSAQDTTESAQLSIAEMVAQAANSFITDQLLPGYVFCEEYGMYYNNETGYYYDTRTSLFYHPSTQCYYRYNDETQSYETLQPEQNKPKTKERKAKRKKNVIEDRRNAKPIFGFDGDLDVPEIACQSSHIETEEQTATKSANHASCIRMIETTNSSFNPILHVVTITGGSVGFGPDANFRLSSSTNNEPTNLPSGHLFYIEYLQENERANDDNNVGFYQIKFNPCAYSILKVNGEIAQSETHRLKHEDTVAMTSNSLILHIHKGLNTCPGCEPGLLMASTSGQMSQTQRTKSRESERRKNIRRMKAEYGLLDEDEDNQELQSRYTDRADKRRKIYSSDLPPATINPAGGIYAACKAAPQPDTSTASVQFRIKDDDGQESLPPENIMEKTNSRGLQLLKGMGWKQGQGLGKNQQGIQQPIISTMKTDRAGLGMDSKTNMKLNVNNTVKKPQTEKEAIMEKTRQRYQQVEGRKDS
ncbi:g-patch domain-containing protein [Ditylenchus destructor]|uniref:G-patch domain-containing protein n=1 Tax=Ditylenchus destructor TaxID=166010 RepID=A0AAD4NHG3_9BILA|nr:g-patch domain-containing protein [Ditylenchus destructor]